MTEAGVRTVTYLFSDIEGSTRLWETEPRRMGPALERHDTVARAAVARHGGRVVKMTGDGLHAAFDDAAAALAAAVDMQLEVSHPPEGVLPLAVRCGLHLGADEQRGGDFFGPAVNRAARVTAAAHGGQVLLTQAVAERVADRLPAGTSLRALGIVRLRDVSTSEQIFQVADPRLRSDFPPLRSLAGTPNNLPHPVNSFVNRTRELEEVRAMLGDPGVRLLTLLGMGGLGKSRLALQAARPLLDDFPDGLWFVELAPVADARSVPQTVASVLGVKDPSGGPIVDALIRYLADTTVLLVLDNCEHLVQACAELARQLLQSAPQVKLLATSRDALQIAGETVLHVPPLAAPEVDAETTPDALAQIDAVRLFIERASAAQPAFRVTEHNAAAAAAICRRLDGIPLALELAAARTRAMSVEAISERLDERFKLLVSGDRTALPRQRTLRALIDWSYDLLTPAERVLLARLSVFAGGWTLEGAEAVGMGGGVEAAEVTVLLARLVEKSLVVMEADTGRYRMLETVRQYARDCLERAGDEAPTRTRHLGFFLEFAEAVRCKLAGPEQGTWLTRLDLERENLLAAHNWCSSLQEGAVLGLRLTFALRPYWLSRGLLALGYQVTLEALSRVSAGDRSRAHSRGLFDAGQICCFMGRYSEARGYLQQSLEIARELEDETRIAAILQPLGAAYSALGDRTHARELLEDAVALARRIGSQREIAAALNALAQILRGQGELAEATRLYSEALALARELGSHEYAAVFLVNLAMTSVAQGDTQVARMRLLEALSEAEAIRSVPVAQAALDACVGLCAIRGEFALAAKFFGAAEVAAKRSGVPRDPDDEAFISPYVAQSRTACGAAAFSDAEAAGRELTNEAAVHEVRHWLDAIG